MSNVLMGNRTQQQPNQFNANQPQQNTTQQQQNPLNNLAALAARFSGNTNGQGNNTSLYNFSGNKSGHLSGLFAMEEGLAEEQMKAEALIMGGQFGHSLAQILLKRLGKHPFYHSFQAACDRFKTPVKGGAQEQGFCDFINELTYNQALYNFVVLQIAIQYGICFAQQVTSGDDRLKDPVNGRDLQQQLVYTVACDTIWMQYFDWISNHPEGSTLFHRLTQRAREVVIKNDTMIPELIMQRYTWGSQQCPWRGGKIAEMQNRAQAGSPILDVANPTDNGFGASWFSPNTQFDNNLNQHNRDMEGERAMWAYIHQTAAEKTRSMQDGTGYTQAYEPHPALQYSHFDKPELKLADINFENRHQYSLSNYGVQIPGTEWWIIRNEDMCHIGRALRMPDGSTIRLLETRCIGTVPIYKIDWQRGSIDYKLVPHKLQMVNVMEALISDPSKLLPYMYEEDGFQKHTFDLNVMETNKFVNDGKIIPVGELKELERQPNMLIASNAVDLTRENEQVMNIMTGLVKQHDPKNKLDAFVLPTLLNRDFKLEDDTNMDSFYESFGRMVKGGNEGLKDTTRVLRSIKVALLDYQGTEFADFVVPYVTNLFNRFLVECRGYCETRDDHEACNRQSPYLRSSNVFDDLDDIVEMLRDHDPATLAAFMNFEYNEFFRDNLEILLPRAKAKTKLEASFKDMDESLRPAMAAVADKTIVMARETAIIEVKNQPYPTNLGQAILKKSGNPMFFAILQEALKKVQKHFGPKPQILIRFHNDPEMNVWVVTPTDFDPQNVMHLRAVDHHCNFVHPYPVN